MLVNSFSHGSPGVEWSRPGTLAVVAFNAGFTAGSGLHAGETTESWLSTLGQEGPVLEVWRSVSPVRCRGQSGQCFWSQSDDFLFSAVSIPAIEPDELGTATCNAYDAIVTVTSASEHPCLLRFWNSIGHINSGAGSLENYKRFCTGRLEGFEMHHSDVPRFPAASALGHDEEGLTVYALSGRHPARHLGSDRQVDAFDYPARYGRTSPSFARATEVTLGNEHCLFISGTASILGHESCHEGDLDSQLSLTRDNILHLLDKAGRTQDSIQTMKVYLREATDYERCRAMVDGYFPDIEPLYIHADICRQELLVEIECFCI